MKVDFIHNLNMNINAQRAILNHLLGIDICIQITFSAWCFNCHDSISFSAIFTVCIFDTKSC